MFQPLFLSGIHTHVSLTLELREAQFLKRSVRHRSGGLEIRSWLSYHCVVAHISLLPVTRLLAGRHFIRNVFVYGRMVVIMRLVGLLNRRRKIKKKFFSSYCKHRMPIAEVCSISERLPGLCGPALIKSAHAGQPAAPAVSVDIPNGNIHILCV